MSRWQLQLEPIIPAEGQVFNFSAWSACLQVFGRTTPNPSSEGKGERIISYSNSLYTELPWALQRVDLLSLCSPGRYSSPTYVSNGEAASDLQTPSPCTPQELKSLGMSLLAGCQGSLLKSYQPKAEPTQTSESKVITLQDNTSPVSTYAGGSGHPTREVLKKKNDHQSEVLHKTRTSFHVEWSFLCSMLLVTEKNDLPRQICLPLRPTHRLKWIQTGSNASPGKLSTGERPSRQSSLEM